MPTKPANPITYAEWNSLASLSDKLLMVNTSHVRLFLTFAARSHRGVFRRRRLDQNFTRECRIHPSSSGQKATRLRTVLPIDAAE
jgi:hypothetical protein